MDREQLRNYLTTRIQVFLTSWMSSRFLSAQDRAILQAEHDVIRDDDGTLLDRILSRLPLTLPSAVPPLPPNYPADA